MLYHYTTFAAFDGIIRCAQLRLNNILNMNDASEMRLFMNGICRALTERLDQDGASDKSRAVRTFFQKELEEEFHYSAYAACFSEYRDDAAQWERYGYLGQGVCIAFQKELLERMVGGVISLQKVYYQTDMREHRLVDDFYEIIKNTAMFSDCLPTLQNLMNVAWLQSAAFKHPSFASEKETRLVVSPFISDKFTVRTCDIHSMNGHATTDSDHLNTECNSAAKATDSHSSDSYAAANSNNLNTECNSAAKTTGSHTADNHAPSNSGNLTTGYRFTMEPRYHVSAERIKKYYPLDLRKMCGDLGMCLSDLVGEIIIGPTSTQSLPILQDYLDDCGLSVLKDKISVSECPLRKPRP